MAIKSLLSKEIFSMLQEAGGLEMKANFLYQHLANNMQRLGFDGMQKYFIAESKDEHEHYQKLVDFVNDMGGVLPVPSVDVKFNSPSSISDALQMSYDAELNLMKKYVDFYDLAEEEGDCVTATFLIEFMQIQRKSVGEYGDLITRLEQNKSDVFEFDEYVGGLVK